MKQTNLRLFLLFLPIGLLIVAGCTLLEMNYSSLAWWSDREDEEYEYERHQVQTSPFRMATTKIVFSPGGNYFLTMGSEAASIMFSTIGDERVSLALPQWSKISLWNRVEHGNYSRYHHQFDDLLGHRTTDVQLSLDGNNFLDYDSKHIFVRDLITSSVIRKIESPFNEKTEERRFEFFSHDGSKAFWSVGENEIVIQNIATGTIESRFHSDKSNYRPITLSPDDSQFVFLVRDSKFQGFVLWDIRSKMDICKIPIEGWQFALHHRFSKDSRWLAFPDTKKGEDPFVVVWDISSNRQIKKIETPDLLPRSIAFSPNRELMAVGFQSLLNEDASVTIWNTRTWNEVNSWTFKDKSVVSAAEFTPDGKQLAIGINYGDILFLDPFEKKEK